MMQIKLVKIRLKLLFRYTLKQFLKTLNIPLIKCEIELLLTWSKNYVLADITERSSGNNDDRPAIAGSTGFEFQIIDTKLYIPVVILYTEKDKKLLESHYNQDLKEQKSGINTYHNWLQRNNYNLNYLIDPTFTKINRLFFYFICKKCWRKWDNKRS